VYNILIKLSGECVDVSSGDVLVLS